MPDKAEQDMTGMPSHVKALMEAALKLEKQQADAQPRPQAAPQEPSATSQAATNDGGQATDDAAGDPATSGQPASESAATDESPEAFKARIAALEAQVVDQRNRLRRHHGQQRASREQMEDTVKNLQAQIKRLEEQQAATPHVDDDDAVLLRNGFTQEDIADMTEGEKRRTVRITRNSEDIRRTALSQTEAIERRLSANQAAGKVNAADAAIETARPGFLAAIKPDAETAADWEVFSRDMNPDSDAEWTWAQTLDHARKVGDRATVLRIADLFAPYAGVEFKAGSVAAAAVSGAERVEVPPRRVMPSSGPAAPAANASPRGDAEPPGQRYPMSYAEEFHNRCAPLRGGTFKPFTISRGGRTRSFATEKAMERERDALLNAADEGRLDRG